jgi:hypothetical protein
MLFRIAISASEGSEWTSSQKLYCTERLYHCYVRRPLGWNPDVNQPEMEKLGLGDWGLNPLTRVCKGILPSFVTGWNMTISGFVELLKQSMSRIVFSVKFQLFYVFNACRIMYNALINIEKGVLILHLIDRPKRLPLYVHLLQTFKCAHWNFVAKFLKMGCHLF